jgi:hypothetical protein
MSKLLQGDVIELLRYQKSTGKFFWKTRSVKWFDGSESRTPEHTMKLWNSRHAGDRADLLNKSSGDRRIQIKGQHHQASRLAMLYINGYMPEEVGHKNKKMSDNRWSNLIESNVSDNRKNRVQRKGKSGRIGVSYHKDMRSWHAAITENSNKISLGYHKSFFEACCARAAAENKLGYGKHFK